MSALDFEEIRQLQARLFHTLDFADGEGFAACFAPGGWLEMSAGERLETVDELKGFVADEAERGKGHIRRFTIGSMVDGDGTAARSMSYGVVSRDFGEPFGKGQSAHSEVLTTGLYVDQLVKMDGAWLYQERRFCRDGTPESIKYFADPIDIAHVGVPTAETDGRSDLTPLDVEAIRQLEFRYCYTLDQGDPVGFADCFTPDGTFEALSAADRLAGVKRGTAELRAFAEYVSGIFETSAVSGRHSAISFCVEGDTERAFTSSYGFILGSQHGQHALAAVRGNGRIGNTGIYRDEVVKSDGRWLFKRRTFRYDGWPDVIDLLGKPLEFRPFEE
jgi:hypothetical protein